MNKPRKRLPQPMTLEEFVGVMKLLRLLYPTDKDIPFEDAVIPSHSLFLDICQRIIALEEAQRD